MNEEAPILQACNIPSLHGCWDQLFNGFNRNTYGFEFYNNVKEEIMTNELSVYGKHVKIAIYVNANHAGDKLTHRSHNGILIFVNSAPVGWYCKHQDTIKSSTFGSKVLALRTYLELFKNFRYKLCMMGVPISVPIYVFGNNKGVVNDELINEFNFTKTHLIICNHAVRGAWEQGIWRVGYIKGKQNIVDSLTKILSGTSREKQVSIWIYKSQEWKEIMYMYYRGCKYIYPYREICLRGLIYPAREYGTGAGSWSRI